MDTNQLHQVLWNLCENALSHSGGESEVVIRACADSENDRPFLDVADDGIGIDEAISDNLFEPFFTTRSDGTGLGLYIARELCEINQASLNLVRRESAGSCFRITFSHPARQGVGN